MGKVRIKKNDFDKMLINATYIGALAKKELTVPTVIDSGATTSYMGIEIIRGLGVDFDLSKLTLGMMVAMYGIGGAKPSATGKHPRPASGARVYASFSPRNQVVSEMKLNDFVIPSPEIRIPVSFCVSATNTLTHIQFERQNDIIIGTNILRNYNYGVNTDETPVFIIETPSRIIPPRAKKLQCLEFEDISNL